MATKWRTRTPRRALIALVAVLAIAAVGCGSNEGSGGDKGRAGTVALLLPDVAARYEAFDRPLFTAKLRALCPGCEVDYYNANSDPSVQRNQADTALAQGAKVLVLDPVDSNGAASIVAKAKSRDVSVIAYDRLINRADVDYYISFDNEKVGELQARALVGELKRRKLHGSIVMINGSPTDNNAKLFKQGAHRVLDTSGFRIAREYDTIGWLPPNAQRSMDQAITTLGPDGFVGVYAANDQNANAAIAAMKRRGIDPRTRPITGQDAELAGIQRIVAGEQFMTVYKPIKAEAEAAAQLTMALLKGTRADLHTTPIDNGAKQVPSVLLQPIPVTRDKIADTIVRDRYWTVIDICSGGSNPTECYKSFGVG